MRQSLLTILCLALILNGAESGVAHQGKVRDDQLISRFRKEAESAWAEYRANLKKWNSVSWKSKIEGEIFSNNISNLFESVATAQRNGVCIAQEGFGEFTSSSDGEVAKQTSDESAFCKNSNYEFVVAKLNGEWVASNLILYSEDSNISRHSPLPTMQMHADSALNHGFVGWPFLVPFDAFSLDDPLVKIVDAEMQVLNGKSLVRVVLDFDFLENLYEDAKMHPIGRGRVYRVSGFDYLTVWFDPERFWVPIRAELSRDRSHENDIDDNFVTEWSYEDHDGIPLVSKLVEQTTSAQSISSTTLYNIQFSAEQGPRNRFKLSHYGLPEPTYARSIPLWVWFVLIGTVLGCCSLWLRKRFAKE